MKFTMKSKMNLAHLPVAYSQKKSDYPQLNCICHSKVITFSCLNAKTSIASLEKPNTTVHSTVTTGLLRQNTKTVLKGFKCLAYSGVILGSCLCVRKIQNYEYQMNLAWNWAVLHSHTSQEELILYTHLKVPLPATFSLVVKSANNTFGLWHKTLLWAGYMRNIHTFMRSTFYFKLAVCFVL